MFYRSSSIVKGQMLLSNVNSDLTANNEFKLYQEFIHTLFLLHRD